MTETQINYAIELAKTLNFRKASERVFISQPGLTYQIKTLEEEIGFKLFERSGKGAALTPAGQQFVSDLTSIKEMMRKSIESCKNISSGFTDSITIGLPVRSAMLKLPEILKTMQYEMPNLFINYKFILGEELISSFLKNETDVIWNLERQVKNLTGVRIHPLYQSHIFLLTKKTDFLAARKIINPDDLKGRTLMVGGTSSYELKEAQNTVIQACNVKTITSEDHQSTLTNIAAERGICLSPDYYNDFTGEFAWTPISFGSPIQCVLVSHENDSRQTTGRFIEIAREIYADNENAKC